MREPPERLELTAVLDPKPRYAGTIHDDQTARAMGFRAALIPGAFIYGHITRMAVRGWGADWLARGRARARFRRPVYNGDLLVIERGELRRAADGLETYVSVKHTKTGEIVLEGNIGLLDTSPQPPLDLPIRPLIEPRLKLLPGDVPAGLQLGTAETVLTPDLVGESLDDFHEVESIYRDRGLVHSGCLLRRTMGDALANLDLPIPVIFAVTEVQNFAPAPVGARYATSSRITRAWESRGKHYFESEEWLIADGSRVVARHLRQNLYAIDGQSKAAERQRAHDIRTDFDR